MLWIILASLIYLLIGFFFSKPDNWNMIQKVLAHIFWLPLVIFVVIIVRLGEVKIM
ncbi:hypothetical protein [Evansella clarkii]|uniref:hypothetical protein n=1 Tax=Evansella clarkii TaxID=79879 RepID=UPI00147521A7|nr:hypothetical protein [Evansella clarkii]